ncbi:hypothetical protein K8T06_08040, partial [bacterium]|nr:hypothetical protein [bacterium]
FADYAGADTWIPMDTSFKQYDLHWVEPDPPLQGVNLTFVEDLYFADMNEADPVDLLMKEFFSSIPDEQDPDASSPLFQILPGKKIKFDSVEYLPNTLPYKFINDSLEIIDEDTLITDPQLRPMLIVTFSNGELLNPGSTSESISDGEQYMVPLDTLNNSSLTVRFEPNLSHPDNQDYVDFIALNSRGIFDYSEAGTVFGRPRLYLGDSVLPIPASSLPFEEVQFTSEYHVYLSVQDTLGHWFNIENTASAGDLYGIIPFIQSIDDGIDLQLVDEINEYIEASESSGEETPTIASDGLWNIDYWSKYLHLQGRHYFKQQYYSEEILAGMFSRNVVRDTNLIRIGVMINSINRNEMGLYTGELASFCDLDLYQLNVVPNQQNNDFFDIVMLNSSVCEHELFFRETNSHNGIVSAAKLLKNCDDKSELESTYINTFFQDIFVHGEYIGLRDTLKTTFIDYFAEHDVLRITVPNHFTQIEMSATSGATAKWIGTGYKIEKNDGSIGYMLFGTLLPAEGNRSNSFVSPREYGGALGLAGTPKFFGPMGMEYEAFCMEQTNLTKSTKFPTFRFQWEKEYLHWLTLGTAKEFRWRLRTYAFKTHHYQVLCRDVACIKGRYWLRVLFWDGQGMVCDEGPEKAPYLVAVFRGDDFSSNGIECISLYNKDFDEIYLDPYLERPEPDQCLGKEPGIKWFDYDPWGLRSWVPSWLPSWNWSNQHMWFGAFFGSATASPHLFKSISPGVEVAYLIERPTPTITPTITPTNTPDAYYTSTPTFTPTVTPTPEPTSPYDPTETPDPLYTVVVDRFCDGFLAHYDGPLDYPSVNDYNNLWEFAHQITRGGKDIGESVGVNIPECDPQYWPQHGLYDNLGEKLFGSEYRGDEDFQAWNFDTDAATPLPEAWVWAHLKDLENPCVMYGFKGHITYCDATALETPHPFHGLCALGNCMVNVYYCDDDPEAEDTPCVCSNLVSPCTPLPEPQYTALSHYTPNPDPDTIEEMPILGEFVSYTGDDFGRFVIVPFHKDGKGRIDYAIEGSDPPDYLKPYPTAMIIEESDSYELIEFEKDIYLENFSVFDCAETPLPTQAYINDLSYVPDHFDKTGLVIEHPHFPLGFGNSVDTFTGKLNIVEPVFSIPMNEGGHFTLNRFYNSTIYKIFEGSNPDLLARNDCHMGLGWEFHLGKVVVSRGELPLIYGPDGSVRTAYLNEDCNWNFEGPYKTRDGWQLKFNHGDDIFDENVTAEFITSNGYTFVCEQRNESFYGYCPYRDCDNWAYTWHVTEIKAPKAQPSIIEITYCDPEDNLDSYEIPLTPIPQKLERRLERKLPIIEKINYKY